MNVSLIRYTQQPELVVALAAKLCYSPSTLSELEGRMDQEEIGRFIHKLFGLGHTSPFEHASFTFGIEGISRVTSHQLVRHRIASYSQQSQRYVSQEAFDYVTPPSIYERKALRERFIEVMKELQDLYGDLIKEGISKEDARYVLPGGCQTRIILTMNARELFHFFNLRCCNRAQWEIRKMADLMLFKVREVAPHIFRKAGPPCLVGPCPEGEMSCGNPRGELLSVVHEG